LPAAAARGAHHRCALDYGKFVVDCGVSAGGAGAAPGTISLEAVAIAGLLVSTILWVLVAIATPLPGLAAGLVQQRIPLNIRQRFNRRHALPLLLLVLSVLAFAVAKAQMP